MPSPINNPGDCSTYRMPLRGQGPRVLVIIDILPLYTNCVFPFDSFTNTIPATELIGGNQ